MIPAPSVPHSEGPRSPRPPSPPLPAPGPAAAPISGSISASARRPLRVLHLIETLGLGGAERHLFNVLKVLPRGEHAVCFLRRADDYAAPLREAGIPVHCLGLHRHADLPRALLSLCNELRRGDFQLLTTQVWIANPIGRLGGALARVPVISILTSSAYEPEALFAYGPGERLMTRAVQAADVLTARLWMRRMVAVSQFALGQARERLHVPPERLVVIPNSVDLQHFRPPTDEERLRCRRGLGLQPDDRVLVSVCKPNNGKGTDLLLSALPQVLAREPRTRLLIFGLGGTGGPDEMEDPLHFLRRARQAGVAHAVRLLGRHLDVWPYLAAADLFVFASRREGLPMSVLEAMACGLPCLLSRIPPHSEIADEGRAALLVAPQPGAWAEAILGLLSDPTLARGLAARGRRRCAERYGVQGAASALDRLFQEEAAPSRWQRALAQNAGARRWRALLVQGLVCLAQAAGLPEPDLELGF